MSGGYGYGGYQGPGYDEDPGQRSVWGNDQGYPGPGQGGGYPGGGYAGNGYGDPGHDARGYGQQGNGGNHTQGTGSRPRQYGGTGGRPQYGRSGSAPQHGDSGGMPRQYDQRQGTGPRRGQDGYVQRGGGRRGQRAYDGWAQDESDTSFLPGFGGRDDYDDGRRAPRGARPGRGPGGGRPRERADNRGSGGPGPGGQGSGDWDPGDRDRIQGRDGRPGDRRPVRDDDWDDRNRQPRKKVTRWFPRILVLAVVAVIVVGGLVGGLKLYHVYEGRFHPADFAGPGTGNVTVQVPSGATAFSLAPQLLKLDVIASERAFTNAAEAAPATTSTGSPGLQAGYFQLHLHMQASLAYAALLNPKNVVQTTVTIPEGKRVSQVLSILAARTKIPLAQFDAAAKETSKLGLPPYAGTSSAGVRLPATVPYGKLEGYLFPATYAITPHETPLQILQAMVSRFDIEAQQVNIESAAKSVGLTPDQLIIEASMVQAEAGLNSDMPKMARVILNRKAKGMPYGFNSVVFYGLGKFGINISKTQAAAAGPYNNTQQTGLPPTAIGNPGDTAIQAILHPASGPWLYFLTTAAGKATQFSATCNLPGTCG